MFDHKVPARMFKYTKVDREPRPSKLRVYLLTILQNLPLEDITSRRRRMRSPLLLYTSITSDEGTGGRDKTSSFHIIGCLCTSRATGLENRPTRVSIT